MQKETGDSTAMEHGLRWEMGKKGQGGMVAGGGTFTHKSSGGARVAWRKESGTEWMATKEREAI